MEQVSVEQVYKPSSIRIKPIQARAEDHAYQPEKKMVDKGSTSVDNIPSKTIGEMDEKEFVKMLVKGLIEAERIKSRTGQRDSDEPQSPAGKALGAVADIAHGIVDIAEGVVRGCVDVVTFGQSRRR